MGCSDKDGLMRVPFNFLAKSKDSLINGPGEGRRCNATPHRRQQFVPRDDLALALGQVPQDLELLRRQSDGFPARSGGLLLEINYEATDGKMMDRGRLRAPKYNPNPREQLFEVDGLCNVILRTQIEPFKFVRPLASR